MLVGGGRLSDSKTQKLLRIQYDPQLHMQQTVTPPCVPIAEVKGRGRGRRGTGRWCSSS